MWIASEFAHTLLYAHSPHKYIVFGMHKVCLSSVMRSDAAKTRNEAFLAGIPCKYVMLAVVKLGKTLKMMALGGTQI